ncbi:N-acetylmuramoyl-L-alanine amidase [Litorisediminicola beolgyonensis]|uniref:N-acetylmuramoyl-L-alanine amidase n=1 Tax=Litorisediminicola beolgyonensis TaxID=1173614 RepID=A0ABW3ZH28_9RHOB
MSSLLRAALVWVLTAVPLGAEGLGALARFDPGASVVRDIGWRGGAEIDLALSQGVPWRLYTLDAPARLVLEFREVDWSGADPETLRSGDAIRGLRFGQVRSGWSRLVAELGAPMAVTEAELDIDDPTGAARLRVALLPTDPESFAAKAGAPSDPRWDLPRATERSVEPARDGVLRVMLDPGHGGIDPGAEADGDTEADLMLLFARELRDVLRRAGGFEVLLTRDSDSFVSLEGRVAAAHAARADLFISLHADALDEGVARGATVYTLSDEASDAASRALAERHDRGDILSGVDLSEADDRVASVLMDIARLDTAPRSVALGTSLVDGIRSATGQVHKRPLRQAGFSVLKAADIPSVLIELGFLSTQADLKNLRDPAWRAGMAAGIRDGLQAWSVEDAALAALRRQ